MINPGSFIITCTEVSRWHVGDDDLAQFVGWFPQHAGITLDELRELLTAGFSAGSEEAEWVREHWINRTNDYANDTIITGPGETTR